MRAFVAALSLGIFLPASERLGTNRHRSGTYGVFYAKSG